MLYVHCTCIYCTCLSACMLAAVEKLHSALLLSDCVCVCVCSQSLPKLPEKEVNKLDRLRRSTRVKEMVS